MTMIARLIGRAEPAGWSWLVRRYCGGRSLVVACCCPKEYPDVLSPFVQRDRHFAGYEISEPALKGRYFLVLGAGLARRHGNKAACQRISERLNLFICRLGGRSMSEAILRIKYWGNNLGVRLPAAVARQAKLRAEQSVNVTVEGGRVVITPIARDTLALEERLARFDPVRHGGEAMVSRPTGAERW